MATRDEFSKPTVDELARRAQFHCSRPICRRATIGPHSDGKTSVSIGVAAHITAAAPRGPRYNPTLSPAERKDISNGIHLCQTCSRIIDVDDPRYPVELIQQWKQDAEALARKNYEDPAGFIQPHAVLEMRPDQFTGRVELLARLKAVLLRPTGAKFLLHGEPGNGKSLTALECAWQLAEAGGFDAVVYQVCGQERSAETVGLDLASKLPDHDPKAPPDQQLRDAKRWLGARRTLLVLDDVWSDELLELVPASASLALLVTSRQSQRFDIVESADIGGFVEAEAEQFFAKSMPSVWPAQRGGLMELWKAFEGSPYALAIAASLLKKVTTRPFAEVLEKLLKGPATAMKDGRRDVSALLLQALEGCSPEARSLVTAVAYCSPQGVWLPFAARVVGIDLDAAHDLVEELAEAALLRVLDREEGRVGIHSLLRRVLREGSSGGEWESHHAEEVLRQFAVWYCDKAKQWQNCQRVLAEAIPALQWLESQADQSPHFALAYQVFEFGYRTGHLQPAHVAIGTWITRTERSGDRSGLQVALGSQALILKAWGRLDEAMALFKEQEQMCRNLGDSPGSQVSQGNQAGILHAWGRLDEAMALLKEQERICRKLGDRPGLSRSLGNQALILKDWGRLDQAMALHKEQERICRDLGDQSGLSTGLGNQALILQDWGRLDEAMALNKEEERICRDLGDRSGLQRSLGNQALILKDWDRFDEALALHKEQERICRDLEDQSGLGKALCGQSLILHRWGRLNQALFLLKEQETICRQLSDPAGLAISLANQAQILREFQPPDLESARRLITEALEIFGDIGMPRERDLVRAWLEEIHIPAK